MIDMVVWSCVLLPGVMLLAAFAEEWLGARFPREEIEDGTETNIALAAPVVACRVAAVAGRECEAPAPVATGRAGCLGRHGAWEQPGANAGSQGAGKREGGGCIAIRAGCPALRDTG